MNHIYFDLKTRNFTWQIKFSTPLEGHCILPKALIFWEALRIMNSSVAGELLRCFSHSCKSMERSEGKPYAEFNSHHRIGQEWSSGAKLPGDEPQVCPLLAMSLSATYIFCASISPSVKWAWWYDLIYNVVSINWVNACDVLRRTHNKGPVKYCSLLVMWQLLHTHYRLRK